VQKNILKALKQRLALGVACLVSAMSFAQNSSSSSYNYEAYPYFGVMLPDDVKGLFSTVRGGGVRGVYMLDSPLGIEVGSYFWSKEEDKGRTFDGGVYYELHKDIKTYLGAGLHYSKYDITIKYKGDGACANRGCKTASGTHFGFYGGGGIILPVSDTVPVKAGVRFYKGPSYWVLIDAGVGIRF
jgi:opacity protein-like surface antigen